MGTLHSLDDVLHLEMEGKMVNDLRNKETKEGKGGGRRAMGLGPPPRPLGWLKKGWFLNF